MHRAALGLLAALALAAPATAASAATAYDDVLELPRPEAARAQGTELLPAVSARPDRVLASRVPGPVVNDEIVLVGLAGDGTPARVELEQRLVVTGTGDYQVRQRGPARAATALPVEGDDDPPAPVTKLGAVVWQGFSPGRRELAARLRLDPGLEAPRLPLSVRLSWTPAGGAEQALPPGGRLPGPGAVRVVLANRTAQPAELPTAADAPAGPLAAVLDAQHAAARRPVGARLPVAGHGLPARLPASGVGRTAGVEAVPLRVTGTVTAPGATASGPGTSPLPAGGAAVAGTLAGDATVELALEVPSAGPLDLRLQVAPVLDARVLAPPPPHATWAAWAAADPPAADRLAALDRLVAAAAAGARAASYSPYLGADLPGTGSTVFRYALAPPEARAAEARRVELRPAGAAAAGTAVLLLLANAALLRRLL